jgi:hypothetical protein
LVESCGVELSDVVERSREWIALLDDQLAGVQRSHHECRALGLGPHRVVARYDLIARPGNVVGDARDVDALERPILPILVPVGDLEAKKDTEDDNQKIYSDRDPILALQV